MAFGRVSDPIVVHYTQDHGRMPTMPTVRVLPAFTEIDAGRQGNNSLIVFS